MGPIEAAAFALLGVSAGLLIGCAGIGGVIVVPVLVYLAGVPVHVAIAAAMCAFLVSGVVGTYVFAKARSIRWGMTAWMWAGAVPAAFAGALFASAVAPPFIELAIGALTAASGAHVLIRGMGAEAAEGRALSKPALASIGTVTGFASAMTGTGGPLVLVPILVWLEIPVLAAVGLAQAIQLPIAVAATGGNVLAGTLDIELGLLLGLGLALGTWAGAQAAHALPRAALRRFVSSLLVLVGGAILFRVIVTMGASATT